LIMKQKKDWTGNSRSAHYAISAKKADSTEEREQHDYYATDPYALETLLDHCSMFLNRMFESCRENT
jgi:hypothetical protein